jgi:hypothetical protein
MYSGQTIFAVGSLVRARGREWVVLPPVCWIGRIGDGPNAIKLTESKNGATKAKYRIFAI